MKQKVGPTVIAVVAVGVIVFLVVMYRTFFPPPPPPDTSNPNGMPAYARDFMKNRTMPTGGGPGH